MSGACSNDDPQTIRIDFAAGTAGWNAGFADYPVGQDAFFELDADYRPLMLPLNVGQNAHYITGNNHSDDLWMYYKGQVAGLDGNRRYSVRFDIEIATNVPMGCVGVGGAPGEGVTVKAGASEIEPEAVVVGADWRMNVDKGNQTGGGVNAVVLGDVASSIPCGETPQWELKQLSSGLDAVAVTTDSRGSTWLFRRHRFRFRSDDERLPHLGGRDVRALVNPVKRHESRRNIPFGSDSACSTIASARACVLATA